MVDWSVSGLFGHGRLSMKKIMFIVCLMLVLFSCSDDEAYYPEIGLNFWINSWSQAQPAGVWTNVSINYTIDNIGGVDLTDIRLHFELTFTNAVVTNVWGERIDLVSGDAYTGTESFYFGNIGIGEVLLYGVGMDDPADDDDEEE